MPPPVFVDTAGWASFLVAREPHHRLTGTLIRSARGFARPLITTNYVLAELSALLISPLRIPHVRRLEFADRIRNALWVEIVHIDRDLDRRSWDLMAKYRDKDFSLVDCSSFLVMKDMGISAAITTDGHFEQAGFQCLLR